MKSKPNTDQFKLTKDPAAFLEGGASDASNRIEISKAANHKSQSETIMPSSDIRVHREQKVFRLPLDLILELKKEAYERSTRTGIRVTETELVEQAIRAFFKDS